MYDKQTGDGRIPEKTPDKDFSSVLDLRSEMRANREVAEALGADRWPIQVSAH